MGDLLKITLSICAFVATMRTGLSWTYAGTTNIAATEAAFTNAYYTLPDNWQITIAAGSFTLNTALFRNDAKSITVRGAGTNATSITLPNSSYPWDIENWSTNPFSITDLNIIGAANNNGGGISIGKNSPATFAQGFFEIARVQMTNCLARGLALGGGGDIRGVVHHCYFVNPVGAGGFNSIIVNGNEYLSWANSSPLGTTNAVVVEDCTFDNQSGQGGNGHFDGYNGGQAVYRHNFFSHDANTGCHGYDSGQTGFRSLEAYNNTWSNLVALIPLETRAGVLMAFDNDFHGSLTTNGVLYLNYYRSCWGSYQQSFGFQGIDRTNYFSGTALSATATTLVATNVPYGTQYGYDVVNSEYANWTLTITGGTGSGQTRTIASDHPTSQTQPGTMTWTVSSSWSPTPDATSTFELRFANGCVWQIGNQPNYTFVTGTPGANREVHIEATLSATLDNLKACMNGEDSGAGAKYFTSSTLNQDFSVPSKTGTTIVWHNVLDGTGTLGYPGAMQEGVIGVTKGTNTGVTLQPCISRGNTLNGTNVTFALRWDATSCTGPIFNTNSVLLGRDYYDTNALPYTLLTYPHPAIAALALPVNASAIIQGRFDILGRASLLFP